MFRIKHLRGVMLVIVGLCFISGRTSEARDSPTYSLKDILLKDRVAALDSRFPIAVRIASVELVSSPGLTDELGDRWFSNDAFPGKFRDEFVGGLESFLKSKGFETSQSEEAVQLKVTLDRFEGRKRVHHDGGDLRGTLTLAFKGKVVGRRDLFESLDYVDESDERPIFSRNYGLADVRFPTILFYRLSLSFYNLIANAMVESLPALKDAGALNAQSVTDALDLSPGHPVGVVTIESSPDSAEIFLDGSLIGSTRAERLKLPPGNHSVVLKKKGYKSWERSLTVLQGNDLTLKATLDPEDTNAS